jgi:hypothetical protein
MGLERSHTELSRRARQRKGRVREMSEARDIQAPQGKLGVLTQRMGAVATTFIAGVELIKKGLAEPVGSLTQLGTILLGKRTEDRAPRIKDFVPLDGLEDLAFGGWDAPGRRAGRVEGDRALPRRIRCALRFEARRHPHQGLRFHAVDEYLYGTS